MKPFDVYPLLNVTPVKASGCNVWDDQGQAYLDLYGGHAVISIGHTHPHYLTRIHKQLGDLAFYSNSVHNRVQEELAMKIGRFSKYSDYDLFLCNSGAEANENAIKLASFHTGKQKLLCFRKAFHGRTSGAVSATDNAKIVSPFNKTENVVFVELNDIEAAKAYISTQEFCGVMIEGIQGVAGIIMPDDGFLQALRDLCTQYNTPLILDEIQSGYGRTGKFFAHEWAGIKPDLITVAKGMGNGFPIGGVFIAPQFKAVHGMLGTTFGGNHLACAAALAVVEVMETEDLIENAHKVGSYLLAELAKCDKVKEVRGRGLMIGIELHVPAAEIRHKLLFEEHIFTGAAGTHVVRLLPPLCLSMEQADQFLVSFNQLISQ